ncbi:MAG: hypothetical protein DIU83_10330, partial [Bacillota bacterium]
MRGVAVFLEGVTAGRIVVAAVAGLVLGGVYFWGLWWTSRRVGTTAAPGLLFFVSFVVRMAVLLSGLWVVTRGRLVETAVAVVGIMAGRRPRVGAGGRGVPGTPEGQPGPEGTPAQEGRGAVGGAGG